MEVDQEVVAYVRKIIKQHVPDIKHHPILHINTRTQMEKVLLYMIENNQLKPTLLPLTALCSNWNNVLHLRAMSLN